MAVPPPASATDAPVPRGQHADRSDLRRRRSAAPSDRRRRAGRHASDPRALRRQLRRRVDPIDRRAHPGVSAPDPRRRPTRPRPGHVRNRSDLRIDDQERRACDARRRDHDRARLPLPGRANGRRRELGEGARRRDQRRLRSARGLRALGGARESILRHGRRDLVGRLGEHPDHRWGRHQGEPRAIPRGRHLRKHDVHHRGRPSGDQWQSGRLVRGRDRHLRRYDRAALAGRDRPQRGGEKGGGWYGTNSKLRICSPFVVIRSNVPDDASNVTTKGC